MGKEKKLKFVVIDNKIFGMRVKNYVDICYFFMHLLGGLIEVGISAFRRRANIGICKEKK